MDTWVILLPIWGNAHIKMCSDFLLPSLLATGNLPYISTKCSITIRFLTTELSRTLILHNKILQQLEKFSKIEFCLIDDLVNLGSYGITLTLAYERGVQKDPENIQVQRCYVFLNGDFVLSNNAFISMLQTIDSGYNSIVCPSLRAIENNILPILKQKQGIDSILDCNNRELVKYALDNIHPTVIAAMLNYDIGTNIAHQYFAKVNGDLLIARYFLLFMLCIKPERPMPMVTSHCDYSFIPELCPSGNYKVITDSDDIFLLEISPIEQESSYFYFGKKNLHADINRLQTWVTKEHLNYSKNLLYFHTDALPLKADGTISMKHAQDNLAQTLNVIYSGLKYSKLLSHHDHHFWDNAINEQHAKGRLLNRKTIKSKSLKSKSLKSKSLKSKSLKSESLKKIMRSLITKLFGIPPFVSIFHYKYHDYKNIISILNDTLRQIKSPNILYICATHTTMLENFFNSKPGMQVNLILFDDVYSITDLVIYDVIFIETNQQRFNTVANFVDKIQITNKGIKLIIYTDLTNAYSKIMDISPSLFMLWNKLLAVITATAYGENKRRHHKSGVNLISQLYNYKNIITLGWCLINSVLSTINIIYYNLFKYRYKGKDLIQVENFSSIICRIDI